MSPTCSAQANYLKFFVYSPKKTFSGITFVKMQMFTQSCRTVATNNPDDGDDDDDVNYNSDDNNTLTDGHNRESVLLMLTGSYQ